jgi:hypothetical protein
MEERRRIRSPGNEAIFWYLLGAQCKRHAAISHLHTQAAAGSAARGVVYRLHRLAANADRARDFSSSRKLPMRRRGEIFARYVWSNGGHCGAERPIEHSGRGCGPNATSGIASM